MLQYFFRFAFFITICLGLHSAKVFGQEIKNVPKAFKSLSSNPKIILLKNEIKVPTNRGHMQGVQFIERKGSEKLLMSGSSLTQSYILQADLSTQKTDTLIRLMIDPYRHAGGIQVSKPYLIVGIEDNFKKTYSKICLYNYQTNNLYDANPNMIITRQGESKQKTAGATGLLNMGNYYLAVVGNWDSRKWDFYKINPKKGKQKLVKSFAAPKGWGTYQSINLIKDKKAIYAIGFYSKNKVQHGDLILVSKLDKFDLMMKKTMSKIFNCKNGVDLDSGSGIQVSSKGNLHVWGVQTTDGTNCYK